MAIEYDREIIASGYNLSKINNNFAKIEDALVDGISRTGQGPNQMEADLDLNSNDLLNVKTLDVQNITYQGETLAPSDTVITGSMLKPQYDPQNVNGDVFDRANHGVYANVATIATKNIRNTITSVYVNGFYTAGDGGGGWYKVVASEPVHSAKAQSLDGRWWELDVISPTVLQIGCKADYNDTTGIGTDIGPFINSAFNRWSVIEGVDGEFSCSTSIPVPKYRTLVSFNPAGFSMGANSEATPFLASKSKFTIIPRGIPKTYTVNAMITECELSGGVLANPNAGKAYTTSSGTRLNTFRLMDFTNRNASGATAATAKEFSAVIKLGPQSCVSGVRIRTSNTDGGLIPSAGVLNFGDAPDVGIYAENPYFSIVRDCYVGWAFRMYALLCLNHNSGDGFTPQADGFKAQNSVFEGGRCVGIRGLDSCRVTAFDATSVTTPYFVSHRFTPSGTIRVGSTAYTYTGLSYTAGSPGTLRFTGIADTTGVSVGADLTRGQDYNDSGVGEMSFTDNFYRAITHPALLFPTDGTLTDRFDSPTTVFEISGVKNRGIHIRGIAHPRDDLFAFINDASSVTFEGYAEPKDLSGTTAASGVAALGKTWKEAGIGSVPYPSGSASNIRFLGNWDQTLTIDTSPDWRPQTSVGRFGSDWNLCRPETGVNDFYTTRSRDGSAITIKLPSTPNSKHPWQIKNSSASARMSMDQNGRVQIGSSLDTETALTTNWNLLVTNGGPNFVVSRNSASTTFAGFKAASTAGDVDFGIDTDGAWLIRSAGTGLVRGVAGNLRPVSAGVMDLGLSTNRFKTLYLVNAPDVSSDANLKEIVEDVISDKLLEAWSSLKRKTYTLKSDVTGQVHYGLIAQDVIAIFDSVGIDPFKHGPVRMGDDGLLSLIYQEVDQIEAEYQRWELNKLKEKLNG